MQVRIGHATLKMLTYSIHGKMTGEIFAAPVSMTSESAQNEMDVTNLKPLERQNGQPGEPRVKDAELIFIFVSLLLGNIVEIGFGDRFCLGFAIK